MRRITSQPCCFLQTTIPVKHQRCNSKFKMVTVNRPYRFEGWHTAATLADLIRAFDHEIGQHKWKSNPRKGTVNGIPMRRIESDTYRDENFTAAELKAPLGFRYWTCDPAAKTVTLLCHWDNDEKYLRKARVWKRFAADPRYLPPLTVPMPPGWTLTWSKTQQPDKTITKTPQVSGFLDDRTGSVKPSPAEAQEKLAGLLDGTVNWRIEDAFGWPGKDELVPLVFRKKSTAKKDAKFWEITGKMFRERGESPKVLYRAMHYFHATKLDELYKGHLVRVYHPEGIAWADIGTWKCWMDIRLYADKEKCEQIKPASPIILGQPHESDTVKAPKHIREWYDLLVRLLETKTMIYSGNDFEV